MCPSYQGGNLTFFVKNNKASQYPYKETLDYTLMCFIAELKSLYFNLSYIKVHCTVETFQIHQHKGPLGKHYWGWMPLRE